jgi:pyruvate dehydrogenase E2 component (dihydrolipoamide acetyltransferase)
VAADIVMPRLSDSMEEGTVLRWLKSPGDQVSLGEELVEIETDKANMVYEAPAGGTLIETLAQEGDTLPIGQVIARVGEAGEKPSGDGAAAKREPEAAAEAAPAEPAAEPAPTEAPVEAAPAHAASPAATSGDGRVKASPLARPTSSERSPPALRRRRPRSRLRRRPPCHRRLRPPSPPPGHASGPKRPRERCPTRT